MTDEKDRFGEKLRDLEKAREDLYFAKRDQELLQKLRSAAASSVECPVCKGPLSSLEGALAQIHPCKAGHGFWFQVTEGTGGPLEAKALSEISDFLRRWCDQAATED